MKDLQFYKSNEILSNKFYQIPQELFVSSLYKDKLNSDGKILYAFLLDRLSLSIKNHWIDGKRSTKRRIETSNLILYNWTRV